MLKEVFASNAAKLVAACVCPVAVGTVALKVPPVRAALHKATAPKPEREARAKPRVQTPLKKAPEREDDEDATPPVREAMMCAQPVMLANGPLETNDLNMPEMRTPRFDAPESDRGYLAQNCGPSRFMIGMRLGMNAVPEPATWAQMVAGFALLGATIRAGRRRRHVAAGGMIG